jgi:hypothetical protein
MNVVTSLRRFLDPSRTLLRWASARALQQDTRGLLALALLGGVANSLPCLTGSPYEPSRTALNCPE